MRSSGVWRDGGWVRYMVGFFEEGGNFNLHVNSSVFVVVFDDSLLSR